jgi:hypothetical protein
MALKLSTGLRNFMLAGGSVRKAFEDAVLNIYSGVAPADPDGAPTGVLLVQYTKASGAVAAGARSTPQMGILTVNSHALNETFTVNVTIDGVGPTAYTYTVLAGEDTVAKVAAKVAQMINDIPGIQAIGWTDGNIFIASRFNGLSFTMTQGGTGTWSQFNPATVAATLINTLKFGAPLAGVGSKNTDVWSGVTIVDGTAGYFRLVTSRDGGDIDDDYEDFRIQGNASTSGAELTLSNINLTAGATETIDQAAFTEPAST